MKTLCLQIRQEWEEDRAIEVQELADLRDQCKTLKKTVTEYKEQFSSMTHKVQLLERQLKFKSGACSADWLWVQHVQFPAYAKGGSCGLKRWGTGRQGMK